MLSLKTTVSLFIAHALVAIFWCILAWAWMSSFQPSNPLIPAAIMLLALFSAGNAGYYFALLDDIEDEETDRFTDEAPVEEQARANERLYPAD